MQSRLALLAAALTVFLGFGPATDAHALSTVDLTKAEKQFKRSCGTCHTVEPNAPQRQGPNLATVMGRTAGTLPEFVKFSEALKAAGARGLVWTTDTLDAWIANAGKYIPKTNMSYRQRNAEKRALVIEYLKSLQHTTNANR